MQLIKLIITKRRIGFGTKEVKTLVSSYIPQEELNLLVSQNFLRTSMLLTQMMLTQPSCLMYTLKNGVTNILKYDQVSFFQILEDLCLKTLC